MVRYYKATKHSGTCRVCGHNISRSQQYAEWRGAGYSTPKLHKECIDDMSKHFSANQSRIEKEFKSKILTLATEKAKRKAAMVVIKEKREFKKALLKEALISINLCVSKLSITNPDDWGIHGDNKLIKVSTKGPDSQGVRHLGKKAFFFAVQSESTMRIYPPLHWSHGRHTGSFSCYNLDQYKTFTEIQLADPRAFEKIGQAILAHKIGDFTPYLRKTKVKK